MFRLYDFLPSGNGYKVRLLLTMLQHSFEYVEVDIEKGESRTAAFLAMNPMGSIPVLELAPGDYLAESNAILCYLAEGTRYMPVDKRTRAAAMQWLFFEQYSHEPNIAVARYWMTHNLLTPERETQIADKRERGYRALDVMEAELKRRPYLAGSEISIADIALYAYTNVAHEGGFDLSPYTSIAAWIDRVKAHPRYIPITFRPGAKAAKTSAA